MGNCCSSPDSNSNTGLPASEMYGYVEHTFASRWENTKKNLGSGGFSEVYLVKNRKTGQLAAAKMMSKKDMDQTDKDAVVAEVNFMRKLQHPNIVQFIDYFDEDEYMYVIIEYLAGGTLFDRVSSKATYNEKEARDLVFIFLSSLKFCHDRDIVHRDIKPENMLMASDDDDANVKLADFGLSIHLPNGEKCMHACGTPNYIAPEMLTRPAVGYTKPVDMWAVGCIAYILLGGYAPFDVYGEDKESMRKLYSMIKKGQYEFDPEEWDPVSEEAKSLIRGLLCVDLKKRLTVDQAIAHPWVQRAGDELAARNLDKNLKTFRKFLAKRKFKAAVRGIIAANKFKSIIESLTKSSGEIDNEKEMKKEGLTGEEQKETQAIPDAATQAADVDVKVD